MSNINKLDCIEFVNVNKNNFEQIKNKATKIGYADGVNEGRESAFQSGFDQGYIDGLTTAFNIEKFRSFFNNLNFDKVNNKDLIREKEEFNIVPIMNLKALQLNDNILNIVPQECVETTIETFAQKMPQATNLLHVQSSRKDFL